MAILNEIDTKRLKELILLDAGSILKNKELRKQYEDLHYLIEGFKPSCTGCSAKRNLDNWKRRYQNREEIIIKEKKIMENTFKLKKRYPRVVIPFTSHVITQNSKDETVWHYLNGAKTEAEKKMREGFFDKLPDAPKQEEQKNVEQKEAKESVDAPKESEQNNTEAPKQEPKKTKTTRKTNPPK